MDRGHPATNATRFSVAIAASAWLLASLGALPLQGIAQGLLGHSGEKSEQWPTSFTIVSLFCLWVPMLAAVMIVSRRWGGSSFIDDVKLRFRIGDLWGLPLGVACQLALVPAVYWPLQHMWTGTFSGDKLDRRAQDLWDKAHGGWAIGLFLMVAIGAPLVEELMYRGLVLQALQSRLHNYLALVISAAFFAAIHLQPVEFPGLFAFALLLGYGFQRSGRLSLSILMHIGFNATALIGLALAS
ncbi:MAG: CPBP family intramembrane glutamic endopeptidase [Actinomycetes bacterium]